MGEINKYIKYISEEDKDEKLSPEEYINMIKTNLKDLINRHKPIEILNNDTTTTTTTTTTTATTTTTRCENFEQKDNSIAINVLFVFTTVKK